MPPVPGERYPDNNTLEAPVSIRKEELRVLIIESTPRWEYRYMRNAMERDPGVEVNTLLFHPGLDKMGGGRGYLDAFPKTEDLSKYDVVFLGDVGMNARSAHRGTVRARSKSWCAIRLRAWFFYQASTDTDPRFSNRRLLIFTPWCSTKPNPRAGAVRHQDALP